MEFWFLSPKKDTSIWRISKYSFPSVKELTMSVNVDLLERAGFKDIMTVMKYVSFEGFLAIK